jgi:hypothetical protein
MTATAILVLWNWAPSLILLIGGLFLSAAALPAPSDSQRLSAVFPPWWSREDSIAAASRFGAVTGFGGLPFIIGVQSHEPELAQRLRNAGALLLFDGSKFPFCAN